MAEKKPTRYDNPPKGKRSTTDPTMSQLGNSAASKAAGEDLKNPQSGEPDTTPGAGPKPELDAGTEAVPVNNEMADRHHRERQEVHGRHTSERRTMFDRHQREYKDMLDRHMSEVSGGDGASKPAAK